MDRKNLLCRYYQQGACWYKQGECPFSHDLKQLPDLTCKYYLMGNCVYGEKCRYDHKKRPMPSLKTAGASGSSSGQQQQQQQARPQQWNIASRAGDSGGAEGTKVTWTSQEATTTLAWRTPHTLETVSKGHAASGPQQLPQNWEEIDTSAITVTPPSHPQQTEQPRPVRSDSNTNIMQARDTVATLSQLGEALPSGESSQLPDNLNGDYIKGPNTQGWGGEGEEWEEGGQYGSGEGYEGCGDYEYEGADGGGEGVSEQLQAYSNMDRSETPLCSSWFAFGTCRYGDKCPLVHGDLCEVCGKRALHPFNQEEAALHAAECTTRHDRLQARLRSADVECCICLEKVLSSGADKRFGLMACDHPFCLTCIRSWRETTTADVDSAVRTCPVCRTPTHFITPSSTWPSSAEEKEQTVQGYKNKLSSIDCQHFDMGKGTCPFGTSCFYRHAYPDGRLEPREVVLRTARTDEGETRVLRPLTLSSFLDTPQATALLNSRRRG